jgi:hypothetical protein
MPVLVLAIFLVPLTACTTIEVPESDINHPANPSAIAAPVASLPDTLNVDAVMAPEVPADPHAGHNMGSHSGHNMDSPSGQSANPHAGHNMEPKQDEAPDPHAGHRM